MEKPKTVFELFDGHPERWVQDEMIIDENGEECITENGIDCTKEACKFCLLGAIYYIYGTEKKGMEMAEKLRDLLPIPQIIEWNDAKFRTFQGMLKKVKEAGI